MRSFDMITLVDEKYRQQHYARLVNYNCWQEKDWVEKLENSTR